MPPIRFGLLTVGRVRCILLYVLLALGGRHWVLAQSAFTITDLGLINEWYSEAHGLNNGGWAVGEYEPAGWLPPTGCLAMVTSLPTGFRVTGSDS